ncbi:site-specific integrase [Caulobacter sp. Root1472]|uniref:tyrosine-type recombinase/integrase n=1 Tax=Caulobacter sp. Root1472 TaxID=1736470 RepID=UPI0006FA75EA|nr:site-specific integrase [Caulobacter sp. Root1472]KQZ17748.1 hypothetical protein ASD47_11710 [Caulobacter sp. Root1472]
MATKNIKIGERTVAALLATGRDYKVFDENLPGFHVRVQPSGTKTYAVFYRNHSGKQRTITLGRTETVKAEKARRMALQRLAEVSGGNDPSLERQLQRRATTVSTLFDHYLEKHAIPNKRPRSVAGDRILWRLHLEPTFGNMKVAAIGRDDVEAFIRSKQNRKGAANRAVALLSTMMNFAIRWEQRADNPCRLVRRYEELPKERALTPKEVAKLRSALDADHDTIGAEAIRFLILTGARRGEVLQATWSQFRINDGAMVWVVPRENLKALAKGQRELVRPLAKEAVALIRAREKFRGNDTDLVFPSLLGSDQGRYDLNAIWKRVTTRSGLVGVRVHDLRHSFASAAFNAGLPLDMIGKVLGHADVRTTQRYAHANRASLQLVADTVSDFYG